MADWTNLPNQAVGVGGLPSGTTVTALRDNPVAITEGAAGAPRIVPRARGFSQLPQLGGSGSSPVGWAGLDPLTVLSFMMVARGTGPSTMEIRASNDGGATYGSWVTITGTLTNATLLYSGYVNLKLGIYNYIALIVSSDAANETGFSDISLGVTDVDAIQFRGSSSSNVSSYRIIGEVAMRADND